MGNGIGFTNERTRRQWASHRVGMVDGGGKMQLRVGGSVFALVVATARATADRLANLPASLRFTSRRPVGSPRACYEVKTTAIRMRSEMWRVEYYGCASM